VAAMTIPYPMPDVPGARNIFPRAASAVDDLTEEFRRRYPKNLQWADIGWTPRGGYYFNRHAPGPHDVVAQLVAQAADREVWIDDLRHRWRLVTIEHGLPGKP
jgi:hypothetical protein